MRQGGVFGVGEEHPGCERRCGRRCGHPCGRRAGWVRGCVRPGSPLASCVRMGVRLRDRTGSDVLHSVHACTLCMKTLLRSCLVVVAGSVPAPLPSQFSSRPCSAAARLRRSGRRLLTCVSGCMSVCGGSRPPDEGYAEFWWAPQQDARSVRALRPPRLPRAEEHVLGVRLPRSQEADVQLGPEGHAPQDHRHWADAVPQDRVPAVQERLPLWNGRRGKEGSNCLN